jgi:hypothetical protein
MGVVRFAVKLPFFLVAEAVLWFVGFLFRISMMGFRRGHEVVETHKKLVDWPWACPRNIGTGRIENGVKERNRRDEGFGEV